MYSIISCEYKVVMYIKQYVITMFWWLLEAMIFKVPKILTLTRFAFGKEFTRLAYVWPTFVSVLGQDTEPQIV